jgi:hypothetical protein
MRTRSLVPLFLAVATASIARADDAAKVDNPQYGLWAKYKPGTSATLVADVDAGKKGKVRLELTRTLRSVTSGSLLVLGVTRASVNGVAQPAGRPVPQSIPAQVTAAEAHRTGTADVTAMGRTFACRVYEVTNPPGVDAPGTPANKATAYLSDDVPGGVVKLVATVAGGKTITFTLTATDVK